MMPTRTTKVQDWADLAQQQQHTGQMSRHRQAEEKLAQLRTFVRQLQQTPQGRLELEQRKRLLGPCDTNEHGEPAENYARLRRWIDADLTHHINFAGPR